MLPASQHLLPEWQLSMPPTTDLLQEELTSFGERLKRLRLRHDWTLEDLAGRSGLSKPYLSRLESGDRQASIAAVLTLSRIFGVSLASMFEAEPAEPVAIIRGGGEPAHRAGGLTCWPLAGSSPRLRLQPMRVIVALDRLGNEHQHHEGEEWIYLVAGELTLSLNGKTYDLEAGDAAHFDARLPHRLIARGATEPEILLVATAGTGPGRSLPPP
jgi:transcriptional regulator with XRE-family HTH domain